MTETITLYHGTDYESALSILKTGLRKDSCLTNDLDTALDFALSTCECNGVSKDEAEIIEIQVDKNSLYVDYPAYEEPLTLYRNNWASTDREWHEMCDNGEIPYPTDKTDVDVALMVTGCVRTSIAIDSSKCKLHSNK